MKIYLIMFAVGLLVIAAGWFYSQGGNNALTDVKQRDDKAATRSEDDRARFDICPVGQWDYGAKKCKN